MTMRDLSFPVSALAAFNQTPELLPHEHVDPRSFLRTEFDRQYVLEFVDMIKQQCSNKTLIPFFLTTTYIESKTYRLNPSAASNNYSRFHHCFLQHLAQSHHISRPYFRKIEPVIYAFQDVPGSKAKHFKFNTISKHESTFHHHCILLANERYVPVLDALTQKHAAAAFALEHRKRCNLRSLDLKRIANSDDDLVRTVDYCSYHARKHLSDLNSLLIYPKSQSELD